MAPALVGLAVGTSGAASLASERSKERVVLRVHLPEEILVRHDARWFNLTLDLLNRGAEPVYVSPVIGQMIGELRILARRSGSKERAHTLYHRVSGHHGHGFADLFKLMPQRRLEREMELWYPEPPVIEGEGWIDVWAEYNCSGMTNIDTRAFAAQLVSEAQRVPVRIAKKASARDGAQ